MQVIINIPKEFEDHFNQDRFEDTLHRLSADAHLLAGNYEQETAVMLIDAFKNGASLPKMKDELIRKILMEVDGGTDDKYLNYLDICERIEQSVNDYFKEISNADSD